MNEQSNKTLRTGNKIPIIGLGTWQLTDDTPDTVAHALRVGYRMIDTSGDYGTQPGIAKGLKRSGKNREDYYIVTKVEETDDAYQKTVRDLQELELDYADLMLIHRPPRNGAGVELWQGLIKAKQDGLTKDIGVSNYTEELIEDLIAANGEVPVVNQIEWSPFGHSLDMLRFCADHDILIQAYSPLTRSNRLHDKHLEEIASHYNKTPAQLLVRWNMQLGTVPIVKANHYLHQEENINVFDFAISEADMETLDGLNERYSALGASLAYA